MTVALQPFVEALRKSGLMTEDDVRAVIQALPRKERPQTGKDLARLLVRCGKLTKFQAQAVYQGKIRRLVLGNYEILDKIGQGGMGQVYRAMHRRMERVVALKVLSSNVVRQDQAVARFQQEVRAAAKLTHPNIVVAYDADEADGMHFLVMEFVAGEDLARTVSRQGPLPLGRAIDYTLQAARGLEYAHNAGVVHRDIKPSNLLLDKSHVVKILDMGLARLESRVAPGDTTPPALTRDGEMMGTLDYMPPEQVKNTHRVDHRADIYSLGCTLHFLLTAKPVFPGDSLTDKVLAHREAPIPYLSLSGRTVPRELNVLFRRMLAKSPEGRPATMAEVIAGLNACYTALGNALEDTASAPARVRQDGDIRPLVPSSVEHDAAPEVSNSVPSLDVPDVPTLVVAKEDSQRWNELHVAWALLAGVLVVAMVVAGILLNLGRSRPAPHGSDESKNQPAPLILEEESASSISETWIAVDRQAWAEHHGVPAEITNALGMQLVLIPPGQFPMGSSSELIRHERTSGEQQDMPDWYFESLAVEEPQHTVELTQAFYLSAHEVTQHQYAEVMADNPSEFAPVGTMRHNVEGMETSDFPVESVSWFDAIEFCNRLSEREGLQKYYARDGESVKCLGGNGYRLPTEAEWEYASRGGTSTSWSCGDDPKKLKRCAWHRPDSNGRPHAVGELEANAFGLYDMHGNVWEWCQDWLGEYPNEEKAVNPTGPPQGTERVVRGGSFNDLVPALRSAFRDSFAPDQGTNDLGLRPARALSSANESEDDENARE